MKLSKTPITLIFPQFTWSDYTNPSKSVLEDIAESLKIAPKVVLNCLDPDYLPHISFYGDVQFILLRLLEPKVKYSADTVQELTTKVALFISDKQIISIHRLDLVEIEHIQSKLKSFSESDVTRHHVVTYFFDEVSLGFNMPITELEHNLENFEEQIFKGSKSKSVLTDGYFIKS